MTSMTLGEFYTAVLEDPDLRRLGPYKLETDASQTIFAIDLDLEGSHIHLGHGDFTDGFVAFCETKSATIDFGDSTFTDLYLDFLDVESADFSRAQASRLYFDDAKIKDCRFGEFFAPEIYFDTAIVDRVEGGNFRAGLLYFEPETAQNYDMESLGGHAHRVGIEGQYPREVEATTNVAQETRIISPQQFSDFLTEGGDPLSLGTYKVMPEKEGDILELQVARDGQELFFGEGDFTSVKVSFGSSTAEAVDLTGSAFGEVRFGGARFENCFLGDATASEMHFEGAQIAYVFCETARTGTTYLETLRSKQFNVNNLAAEELRLGDCRVGEMYMSRGEGVNYMYGERAELELLNLHEGRLQELDFNQCRIEKALINKAHIELVKAEQLRAEKLYIGNDGKNEIGLLELGDALGITEIDIEKALRNPDPETREGRPAIAEISEISRHNH